MIGSLRGSVLAFGLLSIAGLYALFVFVIDHFLRRHRLEEWPSGHPPHFNLEPLGEGRFRLEFLTESGVIGR